MDSGHLYDLTRELRRRALDGSLASHDPDRSDSITEALLAGRRILFAPDDEQLYVEASLDRVFRDVSTGREIGARRL